MSEATVTEISTSTSTNLISKVVRLHVGGLPGKISHKDVEDRFRSFGTVQEVDIIPHPFEEEACRGFAYVNLETSDAQMIKCMNILNGCSWKEGKLQISYAKPSRFKKLDDGTVFIEPKKEEKVKRRSLKKRRNLIRMGSDQTLVTDKNVEKRKHWQRGRYGRAISSLKIRRPNRQILIIDPSHYKNNLYKLFGSIKPNPISQLTWTISDIGANGNVEEGDIEMIRESESESESSEFSENDCGFEIKLESENEMLPSESEPISNDSDNDIDNDNDIDDDNDIVAENVNDIDIINDNDIGIDIDIDNEEEARNLEDLYLDLVEIEIETETEIQIESFVGDIEPEINKINHENIEESEIPSEEFDVSKQFKSDDISVSVNEGSAVEPKFEVNVNWNSLFTSDKNKFDGSGSGSGGGGFFLNSFVGSKISSEEIFKKSTASTDETKIAISDKIDTKTNIKKVKNYAHIFSDLNRITPTTSVRFGTHLTRNDEALQDWRMERLDLKEDFKKKLGEGKRRNRRGGNLNLSGRKEKE